MRVLLADDHDLVLETLASFLKAEGGFEVETCGSLEAACEKIGNDIAYDLVLLDYTMPGMNGLEGLKKAIAASFGRPVAMMSGTASKAIAQEAIDAGAIGFLPKTMAAKSMVNAVRFMAMGETYIPLDFLNAVEETPDIPLARQLSEREHQVLGGLCRGLSNKEIARELDLQEVTIKLHVKTLCRKIDAKNRTHAAMIGKEAGLF
ncbi:putative response regulator receiver protein [Dinoroseobacter shibae DFL 12 = DSM 16493]|jgi:DNA-binding NarL/FixJ family response regulator|uniref:Putative response regulator receiver protein n=1 Tax=Dinoroseobacter shibae (strain DSM 16493 / NCIMB 14021 / DFL 12) TaxID=398580 RepID=A8LNC3_DINSH|nr:MULTISPECIES: response regulator transcription factor [Dinoroseobacter]ABV93636.1 putative response regulator receiver protein [Dinoroseobacter shibae DFL 12 = DSM 16493]MDD9715265.1 response regulator transcription factor [Dinoroseobacter sp. PD6]URF45086.1 response regulator transcription factor [Dinoroseobacter shibae]URF49391.1 response regulator transcription factor [Dinoroseobacter shibae]